MGGASPILTMKEEDLIERHGKTIEEIQQFVEKEYKTSRVMVFNRYYRHYLEEDIDDNAIFMEVRDGHSFVGNVKAFYEAMVRDERFQSYDFYISYEHDEEKEAMQQWMTMTDRTHFVQRLSEEYAKAMATSHYLLNNSTMIASFVKRDEQVYVNTWHGTPLKHMGFDLPSLTANENVLRNLLLTDYIISPNAHTTTLFLEKYKLDGLYEGTIIENGYPRIDFTFQTSRHHVIEDLKQLQLDIDEKKDILLYTPTWKGNSVSYSQINRDILRAEFSYLKE